MALSDILAKIDAETKKQINALKKDFQKSEKEIRDDHEKQKKEISARMEKDFDEKSKNILDNAQTVADRDANNLLLQAKRDYIEEIIHDAITELSNDNNYEKMIITMLKSVSLKDGEIIPPKGKEEATKKALTAASKSYTMSEKSGDFKGGFILKTEKIEMDNSFETIIGKILHEDLEMDLNKLLFNDK